MEFQRVRNPIVQVFRSLLLSLAFAACGAIAGDLPHLQVDEARAKRAAIEKPAPAYPAAARQMKITGVVQLEAIVREDGSVEEVKIVTGNSLLTKSSAEAVKNWRFKPFEADGKPARALVSLSFEFGTR